LREEFNMRAPRWLLLLSLWLCAFLASAQEKKRPLAIEDLYLMESVKSPTLFPKEEKLVYERVWIDAKTKQERHALWLVEGKRENRKPLEERELDGRSPVVSPDGEWIAFLSARRHPANAKQIPVTPPYSDAGVDLWMVHVPSGKVMPLGGPERPWGRVLHDGFYGRVAFSPDSKRLVFIADDGKDRRSKEEVELGIEIVRPDQGEGYTGYGAAQVWVVDVNPLPDGRGSVVRVTDDDIWYGDPQWSPDGKSLVVVANKTKDRESARFSINKNFDLYRIDLATKQQTPLTTNPGPDVSPRWSPDGKQIAYLSVPRNGPHRDVFDLYILDTTSEKAARRLVPNLRNDVGVAFPLPDLCWKQAKALEVKFEEGIETGNVLVSVESGALVPGVLATIRSALIPPTNGFLENRFQALRFPPSKGKKSQQMPFIWESDDGLAMEGIVTLPPQQVATAPFKLIVYPHGGPHSRSTVGFDFTVQLFAAHGYAVFQPNFRGSTGYGKKFLDADRLDLGGGDMRDILTGIDKLVKDGLVDPRRQFVYGISYGGFMTSWLVGQTHQFRAAVTQNAVTDMNMMYGLSDLQSWTTWELGGLPWEQPERYRKHSPLTYAHKVKTPTLILHAREDRRCPLPMGKAFHQALLANGVETQMVIYPNEGHGIRQPRHREDVYRRVLAWFEKHDVK
jgi:dipeptidyl aminopeptidase/acylaminoacyl peptidase